MKIKSIFALLAFLLVFLPSFFSCQSDSPKESNGDKKEFRVRAFIDNPKETRAAIEYGYQDSIKEIFTWMDRTKDYGEDYVTLFNLSKFSEFHYSHNAPMMYLDNVDGKQAEFKYFSESSVHLEDDTEFFKIMQPGDIILAMVCMAHAGLANECAPEYDHVISYEALSCLYDQKIVENPTTASAMKHVHMMMHMYDVVKVDEKGEIPDLHFKHMCSIFRVTLQNKSGKNLFSGPSDIVFTAYSKDMSAFIYGFNYFSVAGNENDGFHLEENFKVTPPRHPLNPTKPAETVWLSHKTTHKINEKSADKIPLKDGETYEFYAVVTPRIGGPKFTPEVVDSLTIDVYDGVESGYYAYGNVDRYTITIPDFNRKIEAGKRYWFKLTATDKDVAVDVNEYDDNDNVIGTKKKMDHKLMFTSEWTDKYGNKNNNGEDTSTDE